MYKLKELLEDIPKRTRLYWRIQMSITEFIWRFHPRRNRWCKQCGLIMGNSKAEAKKHICYEHNT